MNLRQLCVAIQNGYADGKSGMDKGMIDHVLELSNYTGAIIGMIDTALTRKTVEAPQAKPFDLDRARRGDPIEITDKGLWHRCAFIGQASIDRIVVEVSPDGGPVRAVHKELLRMAPPKPHNIFIVTAWRDGQYATNEYLPWFPTMELAIGHASNCQANAPKGVQFVVTRVEIKP